MIRRIRITNFKSIKDDVEVAVRPLTFLMGPNSGGKSSIIQPLLLLRQTVDSRDVESPLSIHGKYLDFGSYRDFIFGHDDRKPLRIDIRFQAPLVMRFLEIEHSVSRAPIKPDISFSVEFGYIRKSMRVILRRASFSVPDFDAKLEIRRVNGDQYRALIRIKGRELEIEVAHPYKFYGASFGPLRTQLELGVRRQRKEIFFLYELRRFAEKLPQQLDSLFSKLFYIGPLREWPKRFYIASGETPQDVGLKGEMAIDVLWIQSRRMATRKRILSNINEWMKNFEMASEVTLRGLGSNTYELKLTDPQTGLSINLADTGFGASQVFPIIVEGFYAPPGSILLIEQPEIHLHPKAQATLADLLVEIAINGDRTLMVETHSEHLISRLLRRIAEGKLKNDDVAIYYCEPTAAGTKVRQIGINTYGQLEPEGLPQGFFEEDYKESFEHLKAILGRQGGR